MNNKSINWSFCTQSTRLRTLLRLFVFALIDFERCRRRRRRRYCRRPRTHSILIRMEIYVFRFKINLRLLQMPRGATRWWIFFSLGRCCRSSISDSSSFTSLVSMVVYFGRVNFFSRKIRKTIRCRVRLYFFLFENWLKLMKNETKRFSYFASFWNVDIWYYIAIHLVTKRNNNNIKNTHTHRIE